MLTDPVPLTAETFNALIAAHDCFVAAVTAVLPRAQRQALAQELTARSNQPGRFTHGFAPALLQQWAQQAKDGKS